MKVRKFNNLWLMGLILTGAILAFIYFLKLIYPEFVIEVAHGENIITIGRYIGTHKWAWYTVSILLSFMVYYFYCCGCCHKSKLNLSEVIVVFATIGVLLTTKHYLPNLYTAVNFISMVLLPYMFKGDFKATVISFSAVNLLQVATMEIRNLSLMIIDFNFATLLVLMIDVYILEALLYFMFNFKKEE